MSCCLKVKKKMNNKLYHIICIFYLYMFIFLFKEKGKFVSDDAMFGLKNWVYLCVFDVCVYFVILTLFHVLGDNISMQSNI